MASLVAFTTIDKNWVPHSRGQFEVIFGALYELYLDKGKSPAICSDLLPKILDYLHCCWPDKYEQPDGLALDYVDFSKYPLAEKREVLRATERLLEDFRHNRLDPRLEWTWERKPQFISALSQFVALMREDIAASRSMHLVGGRGD
jgi:hypothetical protein